MGHTDRRGCFALILHSHIPYVLSPASGHAGAAWLLEAAAETYIPLLNTFHRLVEEGISPRVTLGITPILMEQLADAHFPPVFTAYLEERIAAAEADQKSFLRDGAVHLLGMSHFWETFYQERLQEFQETYAGDIVGAFRNLQNAGHIEVISGAATHAYLPLLLTDGSVRAQIDTGNRTFQRHMGRPARGFWLPECAYRPRYPWQAPLPAYQTPEPRERPGLEEMLAPQGIRWFCVDSHLLRGGKALGVYADRFQGLQHLWDQFSEAYPTPQTPWSPYHAYLVNSSRQPLPPIAALARDPATGHQVWSADSGYPGDPEYLEFHRKHYPGGLRYWKVSFPQDDMGGKGLYEPFRAAERLSAHAAHFASLVASTLRAAPYGEPRILAALYDTELFGHWWFEGPEFLYVALKELSEHVDVERVTAAEFLEQNPPQETIALPEGSWGEGGYHWIWLNESTAWLWDKVYMAERTMEKAAREYLGRPAAAPLLSAAARQLLLMQSSDWPFSISTFGSRDYAEQRFREHVALFESLCALLPEAASSRRAPAAMALRISATTGAAACFPDLTASYWAESG